MEGGKKLTELRVVDLRVILEQRGLEKTGIKSVLTERLSKSLADEGHDPLTFLFTLDESDAKSGSMSDCNLQDDSLADSADSVDVEAELGVKSEVVESECLPDNDVAATSSTGIDDTIETESEKPIVDHVKCDAVEERPATDVRSPTSTDIKLEEEKPVIQTADEVLKSSEEDIDQEEQFVVHVDESDTNLDYDLGDKTEERDAPTPTKDESMDVDASDIVQSSDADVSQEKSLGDSKTSEQTTNVTPAKSSSDTKARDLNKKDNKDNLATSQNLWISGLSSTTRATDLKSVFSKFGKVVGAKVVTNANKPGAKCYGYVTMSSADEATKCIQHLHKTDLHGKSISVERAKGDPAAQARASASKKPVVADDKKKDDSGNKTASPGVKESGSKDDGRSRTIRTTTDEKLRDRRRTRPATTSKKEGESEKKESEDRKLRSEDPLEREKRRLRIQERRMKDEDYRRRSQLLRDKRAVAEAERRVRLEQSRMEREREKMKIDREKMKLDQLKIDALERDRLRLESELLDLKRRVDREREDLKRIETLRLEELRRSSVKRSYEAINASSSSSRGRDDYAWDAKRVATTDRYVTSGTDRRGVASTDRSYSDSRRSDPDRRAPPVVADSRSRPVEDRYRSTATVDRRDYNTIRGRDSSRVDREKPTHHNNGNSRSYDAGRSTDHRSGERNSSWSASSVPANPPSLLGAPSGSDLFSGANMQAADMMMMARSSTAARFNTSSNGGYQRRY